MVILAPSAHVCRLQFSNEKFYCRSGKNQVGNVQRVVVVGEQPWWRDFRALERGKR